MAASVLRTAVVANFHKKIRISTLIPNLVVSYTCFIGVTKRKMSKIFGMALFILGIYFLGQDIIFASHYYPYTWPYFWRDIPAAASVLAIMLGIICLLFFSRETGNVGWILLGFGVVLVFLSGGVFLKPVSLWKFVVAFIALAGGFQLLTQGRLRF